MGMCQAKREWVDKQQKEEEEKKRLVELGPGEPVYLNVYDLMIMNYTINRIGLGVYHTGVEVYCREYSYAGHYHTENTGLKDSAPRDTSWLHDAIFRERILVGVTQLSREEVRAKFEELKPLYLGPSYNVLDRNCNHFTEAFLLILTGKELPPYINRLMKVASKVRPCLPGMFKHDLRNQQAPPEYESHRVAVPQPRDYRANKEARANAAAAAAAVTFADHQYHPDAERKQKASEDPLQAEARLKRSGSEIITPVRAPAPIAADDDSVVDAIAAQSAKVRPQAANPAYHTATPQMIRRASENGLPRLDPATNGTR